MRRRRLSNRELNEAARHYDGPYKPYDLIKELCVAIAVVAVLAVGLTIFFSSPDDKPSTIAQWSRTMPVDFVTTGVSELDGTSGTAGYGPPYNHNGDGQQIAFIHLQKWLGVSHPINTAVDFVYSPLSSIPNDPAVQRAIATYKAGPAKTQGAWRQNTQPLPNRRGTNRKQTSLDEIGRRLCRVLLDRLYSDDGAAGVCPPNTALHLTVTASLVPGSLLRPLAAPAGELGRSAAQRV